MNGLGECQCITAPCNCAQTMEYRPTPEETATWNDFVFRKESADRFTNAMSGMKWLAVGVAAVVLFFALDSRR